MRGGWRGGGGWSGGLRVAYLREEVLGLASQAVGHLAAARGQVEDGGGGHVGGLHVVRVVKAALAAGAAGAAPAPSPSTAHTAAARSVAARRAAGRAGVLTVTLGCRAGAHTHTGTVYCSGRVQPAD